MTACSNVVMEKYKPKYEFVEKALEMKSWDLDG